MSIDKFGRRKDLSKEGRKGDPGIGFQLTSDGHYDMQRKRLINVGDAIDDFDAVNRKNAFTCQEDYFDARDKRITHLADPKESHNAVTLQYYLNTKYNCEARQLKNLASPIANTDAVTKKYTDDKLITIRSTTEKKINQIKRELSDIKPQLINTKIYQDYVTQDLEKLKKQLEKLESSINTVEGSMKELEPRVTSQLTTLLADLNFLYESSNLKKPSTQPHV